MSHRPVLNYVLPDAYYGIPREYQHRSTPMAQQKSTGSTGSEWSNATSASCQSSHSSSQDYPQTRHTPGTLGSSQLQQHNESRRISSSQYKTPPPSSEKSEREFKELQYCPHEDCRDGDGQPNRPFSRKADVSRHFKSTHDKQPMDCPKPRCARKGCHGFTRQDHLVEHLRGYHGESIAKRQSSYYGSPDHRY